MLLLLMGLRESYPVCHFCSTPVVANAGKDYGKSVHDECHTKTVRTQKSAHNLFAAEFSKIITVVKRNSIVDQLVATFRFGDENPVNRKSPLRRYGFAVLAALAALLVRRLLSPVLGDSNPYHTAWAAVVFSAWYCGIVPSAVATLISVAGVWYWFISPSHLTGQHQTSDIVGMIGFIIISGFLIVLGERSRASNARAEREIAERLRAEQEFGIVANVLPDLSWMAHADGHIYWYNEPWYEYTGTVREQMEGWGWQSVHDPEILPIALERWRSSIRSGEPFEMEFPLRRSDGIFQWFLTRVRPVRDKDGRVQRWVGTNTNIQEQRELQQSLSSSRKELVRRVEERTEQLTVANEGLSQLTARLQQSQDEERRRLARELHDSLGQLLTAMKMNLDEVRSSAFDESSDKTIADTIELLNQLLKEVRTISYLLHPPLLDEAGLIPALKWYVEGFSQRSKIVISLDIDSKIGRMNDDVQIAIFRIVQECLTNVHRHSGSPSCTIQLNRSGGEIKLEIRDAGKGLPPGAKVNKGVGFCGMQERIQHLGGIIAVESDRNGTTVICTVPYQPKLEIAEIASYDS